MKIFNLLLLIITCLNVKAQINPSLFAHSETFSTGENFTRRILIEDLDKDGYDDIIATGSSKIFIFKNEGGSSEISSTYFSLAAEITTQDGPSNFAVGDLDGDSKSELAVAHSKGATVYLNNCTIGVIDANSFQDSVNFFTTSNGSNAIALGDIDGDNKTDIVIPTNNKISFFRNICTLGNINFQSEVPITINTNPYDIAIKDLDLDGKNDIVIANEKYTLSIIGNTNTPGSINSNSFLSAQIDSTGGYPLMSVEVKDLNNDNLPEIVASGYNMQGPIILPNTSTSGSISFDKKVDITTSSGNSSPLQVAIYDINGDSWNDILVANCFDPDFSILENNKNNSEINTSSFTKTNISTSTTAYGIRVTDFNKDGYPEVATARYGGGITIFSKEATLNVVNGISQQEDITIYPNPTRGIIKIKNEEPINSKSLTIINSTGKEVFKSKISDNFNELNLETYPKGIYLIRLETENKIFSQEILLE